MRKRQQPTQTQIKKLLAEATFNPRDNSPMAIVVGMNDPSYCESKAIELIVEAKDLMKEISQGAEEDLVMENVKLLQQYHEKLARACSLLVLARAQRG